MLWFCWRARSTGEYGSLTPIDTSFGLIDVAGATNIAKIVEYCQSRGTLVAPFTNFSRFGIKFNLPNYKATGSFSTWAGGVFGGATGPGGSDIIIAPAPGGSGGGGGAATCVCTPDEDEGEPPNQLLTVMVCAELNCDDEEPIIELTVCGGAPPYEWTISGERGTVELVQSGTNNRNVTITPPTESTVTGIAYRSGFEITQSGGGCACTCSAFQHSEPFGCEGQSLGDCVQTALGGGTFPINCEDDTLGDCGLYPNSTPGDPCDNCARSGVVDLRTQEMKDDGCVPCELIFDGATITVEDALGATVVTVISAV